MEENCINNKKGNKQENEFYQQTQVASMLSCLSSKARCVAMVFIGLVLPLGRYRFFCREGSRTHLEGGHKSRHSRPQGFQVNRGRGGIFEKIRRKNRGGAKGLQEIGVPPLCQWPMCFIMETETKGAAQVVRNS